ncbi:intraflagellar transport protein 22 homolog isoform X1 [Brienomyrus brachyistius]|uniref:intraflagellar transport protein 22 homolog isoform X1 n=2 Tax=Brienomyrus brachyistius TaxID=42636 RepID=UPI0020B2328E|nr:intraflagellar transport protein 22 homolog isoform X1 [Brienomyrus brachyistius]
MFKAKILVIGPSESGKTALSDFLSDATETIGGEYRPTQGVRILEFESQALDGSDKNTTLDVELWDCAGDFKFESCWPVLMRDSNGVLIVFNADVPSHLRETETWHSSFVSSQGMQESQCLLIAHHKPGSSAGRGHPALASQLSKLSIIHSNLEEDPEQMRQAFRRYLGSIVRMMSESREREEMSIIT